MLTACSDTADPMPITAPAKQESKLWEAKFEKIVQGVTVKRKEAFEMSFIELEERFQGVEYQFDFQVPYEVTDPETLSRIEVEVVFNEKLQEATGIRGARVPLQQKSAEDTHSKTFTVRVPTRYQANVDESELDMLIQNQDEVQIELYVDGKKVKDLV